MPVEMKPIILMMNVYTARIFQLIFPSHHLAMIFLLGAAGAIVGYSWLPTAYYEYVFITYSVFLMFVQMFGFYLISYLSFGDTACFIFEYKT